MSSHLAIHNDGLVEGLVVNTFTLSGLRANIALSINVLISARSKSVMCHVNRWYVLS